MSSNREVFDNRELLIRQQFYNTASYLPLGDISEIRNKASVGEILEDTEKYIKTMKENPAKEEAVNTLHSLRTMIKQHPELQLDKAVIDDMSWKDNDDNRKGDYPIKGMQACTFTTVDGDTFIAFRGTPAGSWVDNAKMLMGSLHYSDQFMDREGRSWNYFSPMQEDAMRYMETLVNRYGEKWLKSDGSTYATGHSKGANLAFVAMLLYGKYLDASISIDAPNFSDEQIAEITKNIPGAQLERILERAYSINASNDFVSPLGRCFFLDENIRWVKGFKTKGNPVANHLITSKYDFENGVFAALDAGRGPFGNFIKAISDRAMELPPVGREKTYLFLMSIAQIFQGEEAPVETKWDGYVDLAASILPGVIITVGIVGQVLDTEVGTEFIRFLDEEGVISLEAISDFKKKLARLYEDAPIGLKVLTAVTVIGISLLMFIILVHIVALLLYILVVDVLIDIVKELLKGIGYVLSAIADMLIFGDEQLYYSSREFFEGVIRLVKKELAKLKEWWDSICRSVMGIEEAASAEVQDIMRQERIFDLAKRMTDTKVDRNGKHRSSKEGSYGGHVGVHYENLSETCRIIESIQERIGTKIRNEFHTAIALLEGLQFHRVSTWSLISCRDRIMSRSGKLENYKNAILAYNTECQNIETQMTEMIKNGEIAVAII